MKKIFLYSDGSSLGNPGPGGWGTILRYNDKEKELFGADPHTTNNKMELMGVIKGLESLKEPCEVHIYSDSSYVVKAINEWLAGWAQANFRQGTAKEVKNIDLWRYYMEVAKPHTVFANWVKGHAGHEENERCDKLAYNEAQRIKNNE
ncbi:MAG: ribonuclease HI [Campylobacterota bacterium]|nr:ribonuclease HI [Campylobacterota bacterium]